MMPSGMPLRGPPGGQSGPRTGTTMRGPMGRGDYGKCGYYSTDSRRYDDKRIIRDVFIYNNNQAKWSLVCLFSQVTILKLIQKLNVIKCLYNTKYFANKFTRSLQELFNCYVVDSSCTNIVIGYGVL